MKKEFVPFETAKKLRAIGFDESCCAFYEEERVVTKPEMVDDQDQYRVSGWRTCKNSEVPTHYFAAATFSQAFRWFRDTHNLIHEIQIDRTSQPKFCYAILQYEHYGNYEEIRIREWYLYRTYEEAELACLENLIEVVESKSEQDDQGTK